MSVVLLTTRFFQRRVFRPNRLIVDEATSDDNSGILFITHTFVLANSLLVATLNPVTMETLQLFRGDTIIVRLVVSSLTVSTRA